MKPVEADPVKLFFGVLYSDETLLNKAFELIEAWFSSIDFKSDPVPFDITDYYVSEMGESIQRRFVTVQKLVSPKQLARAKLESNDIEDSLAVEGERKVNLDPGYLDYDKVVLASAKYNGDKVYLDFGIWADLTLRYKNGKFESYPWSFPDFKAGLYHDVFKQIRETYKEQRRKEEAAAREAASSIRLPGK
ncbi:DUF4416 family protein [candidate division KSB1 bacterium]|nr:DUF4416 family protein [candidate division KSB1 bacterium]